MTSPTTRALPPREDSAPRGLIRIASTPEAGRPAGLGSWAVVVLATCLTAIGLVALYSATGAGAGGSAGTQFLMRQLCWVALAFGAMFLVARVPYVYWARRRWWLLGLSALLLGLVFAPGIGAQINGAHRWLRLGSFFFQPSEAARLAVAIFLCAFAASDPERLRRFFRGFLPAMTVLAVMCGLILVEPDVGSSLFIAMVMTLTLIVAGLRFRHLVPVAALGGTLLAVLVLSRMDHFIARWEAFLHPERDPLGKGHQIIQSLTALGSGGWFGVGLGRGMSKLSFLPEVHSDFIFPVIGEELGFVGAAAVILLYMAFGLAGYTIMRRAPGPFGFLLAFAVTTYIILQAAMNVAVVTAAMPTKGIPLPFVSAGGSSLLFTMIGTGLLVSIARASERGECPESGDGSCSPEEAPAAMSFLG